MSDNISITPGTGVNVAAENISGAYLQRVKVALGDLDADAGDLATNNPMPVTGTVTVLSGTAANLLSQVSGTVTAISGTAGNFLAAVSGTVTATGTVTVVSGTAGNLNANVSGSVTALSGTAGNLLCTVTQSSALVAQVTQGTAANLLCTVTQGSALVAQVTQGTASNFLATVSQGTAANLNATVTGTVAVTQGTATSLLAQVSQGTAANLQTTATVAAGTAIIGQVISGQQASIYSGTTALTVSYASVAFTASGANSIISAVANKNIYVLSGVIVCSVGTNIQFWSGSAGTAVTGVMACTANMGFQIPYNPLGNFCTQATNQAIYCNTSVAGTVGGWLTYVAY